MLELRIGDDYIYIKMPLTRESIEIARKAIDIAKKRKLGEEG
ncbi:unnamed protein product [marine sediment metagenome]|uniref:Uncharacterized protein n=1 Tax=marine sediment metagenome TaxID=412755 RepID=X1NAB2_9ZZZZ